MAKVIKGVFPESPRIEKKKDEKKAPAYILHVSIMFSDPVIWRRIQVPGDFSLAGLHDVLQKAMGWSDSHMHQFLVGKISYEPAFRREVPIRETKRFDEYKYKLHTLEEGMGFVFTYYYNAGEGWEHAIHVEKKVDPGPETKRPLLLDGERACPPEEVGDVHEFQQLLCAWENPGAKNSGELRELSGRADYDPAIFDIEAARSQVEAIEK